MIPHPGVRRLADAQRRVRVANPDRSVLGLRWWRVLELAGLTCLGAAVITTSSATAGPPQALTSPPTVAVGHGPLAIALDAATNAVSVANQTSDSVSVLNAEHCTTRVAATCGRDISLIAPGVAVDTVYLANDGGGVPMVNSATTTRPARQTSGTQTCRLSTLPRATMRAPSQHLQLTSSCPATWRHRPSPSAAHRRMSW